jgi:hypothetical protein
MAKNSETVKKKKIQPAHVVIIALTAAIAGLAAYILWPDPPGPPVVEPPAVTGGRGTVATPDNINQILENRGTPPPGGHYITTMNNRWTFSRWNMPSQDAYVENDIRNDFKVYFDVTLEDGSLIYSSPFIPQGSSLRNFALDAPVDAGEYRALVTYFLVDDDDEEVSRLTVRITLNVLG